VSDAVLVEQRGRVLVATLNRPDQRNAINSDIGVGLADFARQLDDDADLTVGVLTGAGAGFCAGMDLKAFAAEGPPKGLQRFFEHGSRKPLVCAVEGFALAGGLEVALVCDLVVAAAGAKFGIPEVGVGLFAAGGGLLRLPRRLPYGLAAELALTADPIAAEEAHRHGLVNRVVEPGQALDAALVLAERIARNAPLAVAASKHLLRAAAAATEEEFWELQAPLFEQVFTSSDAKEGPRAFAEKLAPSWTGT
jgi:enoyl-CoA hydratase